MRHPHHPVRAAAWHRAKIEQQDEPGRRLWAAANYLASVLRSMPTDLADEVATAAAADLAERAERAMAAVSTEQCR